MIIDLISTDGLAAIQLIYAAKTAGVEFDTVWIVGRSEADCRLLNDYAAIGGFTLRFIADHQSPELVSSLRTRGVGLALQIGSVMIRSELRTAPAIGILNLHSGMLPTYRGLESATWAVLEGGVHGVTAHLLAAGVDTGPVVLSEVVPFVAGENLSQLLARTHNRHKWQVFVRAARGLRDGELNQTPQAPDAGRQYFAPHPKLVAVAKELLLRNSTTASA